MDQQQRTKGVADIVFLIDVTASMQPCIDALKNNISTFIDTLATADSNNPSPVKDWRSKVVGYRDVIADGEENWFINNAFVRDATTLKGQLASLQALGGGDIPESLLDALYRIANMAEQGKEAQEESPNHWRYKRAAARVIIVFTDAPYHQTMSIAEALGGTLNDVNNLVTSKRIFLSIFAPDLPCYDELAMIDKSEYEAIPLDGRTPQDALKDFTEDQEHFKNTLKQLAASVSASAAVPRL